MNTVELKTNIQIYEYLDLTDTNVVVKKENPTLKLRLHEGELVHAESNEPYKLTIEAETDDWIASSILEPTPVATILNSPRAVMQALIDEETLFVENIKAACTYEVRLTSKLLITAPEDAPSLPLEMLFLKTSKKFKIYYY